jgi:uncharacterized membrane protein
MKENGMGGHVALMEEEKRLGNLKERDHLEDQGADGRILTTMMMIMIIIIIIIIITIITIIIIIIINLIGIQARVWSGLIWLRICTGARIL